MKKYLIVANWKCNPQTLKEAEKIFNFIKNKVKKTKNEIVICPPFIYLLKFKNSKNLKLGAQNCHFSKNGGAFTGEISPLMLKNLGVKYVILGHSERRALGESDEIIFKKIISAQKVGLNVILCIGETLKEKKANKTFKILKKQLNFIIKNDIKNIILAYEPVWAIGTNNPCKPDDLKNVLIFLKGINKNFKILYGGSIDSKNFREYLKLKEINGLLIGSASINIEEFRKIIYG
ncbi:MAG: triose-phosphate isomerase [Minisyncoccia bacterium]